MKRAAPPAKKKATVQKSAHKAAPAHKAATRTAKKAAKQVGKKRAPSQPGKKAAARPGPRADLGAPVEGFFLKQPPALRAILDELRQLVEQEVPRAESAIKWGNPFYTLDGATICALSAHKSHVNLILAGPPGSFADPHGRLTGEGKTGRHLKLTSADQIPHDEVRAWLRKAAAIAAAS